jgi:hypothetical protein
MSRKSGHRFSEKDMRQRKSLEERPTDVIGNAGRST